MMPSSEPLINATPSEGDVHQPTIDRDRHFDGTFASAVKQHWDSGTLLPISILLLPGRVVNIDEVLRCYP